MVSAPRESVQYLKGRLKPVDAATIQQWIADLNADKFATRQNAAKALAKAGEQTRGLMRKATKESPNLETQRRLLQILKDLPELPDSATTRTIRAIMVLERIGSAEAQSVLRALAGGAPGARDTEEAKASLERLARRPSRNR